jgi:secondary thiamine-phosphate synthase enzyme
VHQRLLSVQTRGRGLHDVTGEVAGVVGQSGVTTGLCSLFLRHTSASLVIQENADAAVLRDLSRWMDRIAPEGGDYEHDAEGSDDMPSHLRTSITRTSESIPVTGGVLSLGTWQAIYVWEHRRTGHRRGLVVHVAGD